MSYGGLTKQQKELQYFGYEASTPGAEVWIALFAATFVVGLVRTFRINVNYMYILPFSAALELVGYVTRLTTIQDPVQGPFIVSILFILLAPIFLALINYVTVGLIIESTGKKIGCINPTSISRLFFASDFAGLIVQGIGGSILASATTKTAYDLGANVILAGLAIQLFFFTIFTYMMFMSAFSSDFLLYQQPSLKQTYNVLFVTTVLIYIRNLYRLIDYASGHTSYLQTHEWIFFVFESVPMFLVCCIYCLYHFGEILPAEYTGAKEAAKVIESSSDNNNIVYPVGGGGVNNEGSDLEMNGTGGGYAQVGRGEAIA